MRCIIRGHSCHNGLWQAEKLNFHNWMMYCLKSKRSSVRFHSRFKILNILCWHFLCWRFDLYITIKRCHFKSVRCKDEIWIWFHAFKCALNSIQVIDKHQNAHFPFWGKFTDQKWCHLGAFHINTAHRRYNKFVISSVIQHREHHSNVFYEFGSAFVPHCL